ncbi:tRNA nucleotidyltransferase (CCA-adding enzyme) [Marinospirillum celere]|uniref:tRNA nucleotidyltransferase (CCA-adding enzyme) n=1 Tax=Marinospirillum celere TaxID=1122252 RepID=A0A1I1GSZ0_9GAMM|nr:hypothetical protein [Marinospirillum celere]SFC14621.1 tRNA nucleotidyltransferase (CCA-adding enzyme) [Marinospirillum celere]
MQIYLVGGAVRDKLLGLPVKDRDWVVVGATPEQMQAQGFKAVGKDFPVFLHPKTQEEYALARTERKQGRGYKGFVVAADPSVTLEEDLLRRDLTINALAETAQGEIIDPFGGQQDLQQRLLRAVSPAFAEDPLRVLRTARFAARFADLGFTLEPETQALMRKLVDQGELAFLTGERIWLEMDKALSTSQPGVFFAVLEQVGALQALWPELAAHWQRHPELPGLLSKAAEQALASAQMLALVLLDLPSNLKTHFLQQVKAPKAVLQQAEALQKASQHPGLRLQAAEEVLELFEQLDSWRRPELTQQTLVLLVLLGQLASRQRLLELLAACRKLSAQPWVAQGLKGPAVGEALREERLQLLAAEI